MKLYVTGDIKFYCMLLEIENMASSYHVCCRCIALLLVMMMSWMAGSKTSILNFPPESIFYLSFIILVHDKLYK